MELSQLHIDILNGKVCPYCKNQSEFTDSSVVYGRSYGKIYLCKTCKAWVGVHKNTHRALGRLANDELREWKKEAHKYFDVIWKERHDTRGNAYSHLAKYLGLPLEYCHIGMFSVETCKKVVDWSKMILNDLRRLDMDFGIDVKREHFER